MSAALLIARSYFSSLCIMVFMRMFGLSFVVRTTMKIDGSKGVE